MSDETLADEQITDLLRMDCLVSAQYASPITMIVDLLAPALRVMIAKSGGTPPVGSVITIMMSVDTTHAILETGSRIILPGQEGRA